MGCEYVCRCRRCMLQPGNARCGRTVTGVSILTNLAQHTCGDLKKCGDFFCKQCFHTCRLNPASHQCKPPGDPGTLTPEHMANIQRRVEARREGKRRKRKEMAVLREIARQQTTDTDGTVFMLPNAMSTGPSGGLPMLSQLADAAADAIMQHDLTHTQATDMPFPGIKARSGRRKRPVYEQVELEAEEWLDDGAGPLPPAWTPASGTPVEVTALPLRDIEHYMKEEVAANPLLENGVIAPTDADVLVSGQQDKQGSTRMVQMANLLSVSVQKIARLSKALGSAAPEECCDDALAMLTNLQQLEKKLMDQLLQQAEAC